MDIRFSGWAWVDMNGLTPIQIRRMKRRLTVRPRQTYYGAQAKAKASIELYVEDLEGGRFGIPRAFVTEYAKRDNHYIDRMSDGLLVDLETGWKAEGPYVDQEVAVRRVLWAMEEPPHGAILQGGCGSGKTATGLEIARRLGRTTLVMVHKEFLMDQWVSRIVGRPEQTVEWEGIKRTLPEIKGFWPDAKVGIVRGKKCDIGGKDIVMAMVQSLASRDYGGDLYRWPGTVMVDECHRIAANTWAPLMPKFQSKYRLGLTATPRRKDGADNVFWYHIGPICYEMKVKRKLFKVRRIFTGWTCRKNLPDAILLSMMCGSDSRTRCIVDELRMAVEAGRKVLVLGERLNLLESIKLGIEKMCPGIHTGIYTGEWFESTADRAAVDRRKLKRSKRKKRKVGKVEKLVAELAQVIFATKQTAEEGLDIWGLDTLFLVTPMGDVQQPAGRIERWPPLGSGLTKADGVIVDFVDDVTFARTRYGYRMDFYRSLGLFQEKA